MLRERPTFEHWVRAGEEFGEWAAAGALQAGLREGDVTFGYTCGSLELIRVAKQRGASALLGQIDPGFGWYRRRRTEWEAFPCAEVEPAMPSTAAVERLRAEWDEADVIIVNSEHTGESLAADGVPRTKMHVIPLCIEIAATRASAVRRPTRRGLRVLFVGRADLMKGYHYLGEASRTLGAAVDIRAAGANSIIPAYARERGWRIQPLGRLDAVQLDQEYRNTDVLVFPTLSDGFGMVQLEAMAHGVPVVATRNCGAVVDHERNGLLIDEGSADAIVEALAQLSERPDIIPALSEGALTTARRFSMCRVRELLLRCA